MLHLTAQSSRKLLSQFDKGLAAKLHKSAQIHKAVGQLHKFTLNQKSSQFPKALQQVDVAQLHQSAQLHKAAPFHQLAQLNKSAQLYKAAQFHQLAQLHKAAQLHK